MAKLTNLLAHLRGRIGRQSFTGLLALLAFVLFQFGATQWAQAQQPGADFDHSGTGFVLNAQHQNVRCETCHLKGIFKGTPKDCVSCHGWVDPRATTVMPINHIPTGNTTCESCHHANMAQFGDATLTFNHVQVRNLTCVNCHSSSNPHPNVRTNPGDATHKAVIASGMACDKCHTTIQFTGPKIPSNHIPVAAVACIACHTSADYSVMPLVSNIHMNAQSKDSNCAQCHSADAAIAFAMPNMKPPLKGPPGNHIAMNGQSCEVCHVGPNSSVKTTPVPGETPNFANSAYSHKGVSTGCDSCHGSGATSSANLFGVTPKNISSLAPAHMPITSGYACEKCHTNSPGATQIPPSGVVGGDPSFSKSNFLHSGTSASCDTCHGNNVSGANFAGQPNIIGMVSIPSSTPHIPSAAACDSCHKPTPTQLLVGSGVKTVPGTGFQTAKPVPVDIHAAVGNSCVSCHEAGKDSWVGMDQYQRTAQMNASVTIPYIGFQTRPNNSGAYSIPDPGHQNGGDCSLCHTTNNGFAATNLPSSHIPIADKVTCVACHKTGDYTVVRSLRDIHANAKTGLVCADCHSDKNAAKYPMNQTASHIITAPGIGHVDQGSLGCEDCHIGQSSSMPTTTVQDNAKFSGSAFIHTGIQSGCSSCHGDSSAIAFLGVTPKAKPSGHIPSSAVCEDCHTKSLPRQIPLSGGTAPDTFGESLFSHKGIASGCDTCHGATVNASGFYGMSASNLVIRPLTAGTTGHLPTPFNSNCESCHSIPSTAIAATTIHSASTSLFATILPKPSDIHSGVAGGCNTCHESGSDWDGVASYLRSPTQYIVNGTYTGFQTRPDQTGFKYSVQDPTPHPDKTSGDCSNCHVGFDYFGGPVAPQNHIPYVSSANCGACHVNFTTAPAVGKIHANIQNTSSNCVQCHSVDNAKLYASTTRIKPIVTPNSVANHVPMGTASCEVCHIGATSSIVGTPVADGAIFGGSAYSHVGRTVDCATCHGPSGSTTSYFGIANMVAIPPTSPAISSSHIPSTASCDSCHKNIVPSGQLSVTALRPVPGSLFSNSPPSTGDIHANVTSCNMCHEAGMDWMGMNLSAYTRNPSAGTLVPRPYNSAQQYTGFQTRPVAGGTPTSVDDDGHIASGECSQCHGNTNYFAGLTPPDNHIPYDSSANCTNCHGNFSTLPGVSAIHFYSQTVSSCDSCHSKANAQKYNVGIKNSIVTVPDLHISQGGLTCDGCHVGAGSSIASTPVPDGAKFSNSLFSHTAATETCEKCHGASVTAQTFKGVYPKTISNLSPVHVPVDTGVSCDSCHTKGAPTILAPAQGMTTFAGAKYLHPTADTGCVTCHGPNITNGSFFGINPIVSFGTIAGTPHLPTTTTCENCHVNQKPKNLIVASSTGTNGFRNATDLSVAIHKDAPGNCSSCHEAGLSWLGMSYLLPTPTPSGSTGDYVGFQLRPGPIASAFTAYDPGHPDNKSGDCSLCHGDTLKFGQPSLPSGHIPYVNGTACNSCHIPFGKAPTVGNIHSYIQSLTTNCAQCHDSTNARAFVSTTTLNPIKTQDSDFSNHITLAGLDCSDCHMNSGSLVGTTSINGAKVTDGSKFSGSAFNHKNITTGCVDCHGKNVASGSFFGVTPKTVASLSPVHIPVNNNVGCEICHGAAPTGLIPSTGATTKATTFYGASGATFIHTYITTGCVTCHGSNISGNGVSFYGVNNIVVMPTTGANPHIPTTEACENCHQAGSIPAVALSVTTANVNPSVGFKGSVFFVNTATIHGNVKATCGTCHEAGTASWVGMQAYYPQTIDATDPTNKKYMGFHTRPLNAASGFSVSDPSHPPKTADDCSACHGNTDYFAAQTKPTPHIPYNAAVSCNACHKSWGTAAANWPTLTDIHTNSSNSACVDCHSVDNAKLYSSNAARAVVGPDSVKHVPMHGQGCETCHVGPNSSSTSAIVATGTTFAKSAFFHGTDMTTNCAECHGPAISGSSFQGIASIITFNAPTGVDPHFPSSTVCEDCHRTSMPAAQVPGNAPHPAPNSGFKTTPWDTAAVHKGVTGSCATCHEKNMKWMSMDPSVLTSGPGGQKAYTGFNTRPYGTAGLYTVADSLHTTTGDCSNCHTGTDMWLVQVKPSNHIPVQAVSCDSCHKNPDYGVFPTSDYNLIHQYAPTTSKCADCHLGSNAATYSSPKMTVVGSNDASVATTPPHVSLAALDCKDCHVGAKSSMVNTTSSPWTFKNSAYDHKGATATCTSCHSGITATTFQGGIIPVTLTNPVLTPVHVPNPAALDCVA